MKFSILTTLNLFSYTAIIAGTSPAPPLAVSRVMPSFEYTDPSRFIQDNDRELTRLAMSAAEGVLHEDWADEDDDHWKSFLN